MESASKNTIVGLKIMGKSGLEKYGKMVNFITKFQKYFF